MVYSTDTVDLPMLPLVAYTLSRGKKICRISRLRPLLRKGEMLMATREDLNLVLAALRQLPPSSELQEMLYAHLSQCVLAAVFSITDLSLS